ncbi:hypothetical protein [Streptomyces sp. UNOC14_S4]|uniref:hypothetical protein n=1 Tax=Streptomyces sp. UNOC14_S4 TaxID=2872340 RepID=UPI001E59F798|nr:hypothetical protein [Streptomyces sp. UNOC14_S4]MCC3770738.1 hypothetical protein [Streptomyces sp. UNOC14_S4]
MNWKKKAFGSAAVAAAAVIGTATAASAEGPHYPQTQGAVGRACAYNWVQSDTQGFPGWHGKHVFVSGMTYNSAALITVGCYPKVRTTYINNSGNNDTAWAEKRSNGAYETALWAGYYQNIKYTDMWVELNDGSTVTGTSLRVDPYGKIIFQH